MSKLILPVADSGTLQRNHKGCRRLSVVADRPSGEMSLEGTHGHGLGWIRRCQRGEPCPVSNSPARARGHNGHQAPKPKDSALSVDGRDEGCYSWRRILTGWSRKMRPAPSCPAALQSPCAVGLFFSMAPRHGENGNEKTLKNSCECVG